MRSSRQFIHAAQLLQTFLEFGLDALHRLQHPVAGRDVMALGIDGDARQLAGHLAGEGIEQADGLDLLVEQFHPHRLGVGIRRIDVDDLTAHPVGSAAQFHVVAAVLQLGETAQQLALIDEFAPGQMQHHAEVGLGVTQTVDARHRGNDHYVAPLHQRLGGGESHLLDMLVDGGILLDIGIRGRHIGLRLIIVIIRNEVFHGVVREELPHLAVELGRQGLVGGQDQGRSLHLQDDIGDGEGLA